MRLIIALIPFLLALSPLAAYADFEAGYREEWREACKNNLADELDAAVTNVEVFCCDGDGPKVEFPRLLAAKHAPCIDAIIDISERRSWGRNERFRQWFVGELKQMRDLFYGDLDGVYRLAKFYRQRGDDGLAKSLEVFLSQWAMDHNHPPAEFDLAQGIGSPDGMFNEGRLRQLAESGYLPAIEDMARRKLYGDGVDVNRGEAWYWLKRAQQANADTSSITTIPLPQILKELNEKERYSLAYLAHVHDDLDLSNIEIPLAFAPLTASVPDPLTDREIAMFINRFKGIKRRTHVKAYLAVEHELMARAAGLRYLGNVSLHGPVRPLGMGNDEFVRRKCNFQQAIDRIFPQGRVGSGERLEHKEAALSSQFEIGFAQYVKDIQLCGWIHPNAESRSVAEALKWAKELTRMNPTTLRKIAAEHLEMFGSSSLSRFKIERRNADPEESYVLLGHYFLAKKIQKLAAFKEKKE